jgi:class 3 adenylate cyclase/CHAT domain-containing protein
VETDLPIAPFFILNRGGTIVAETLTTERSIGDLLRALSNIEQEIEKSRVERCVMFADVEGYTAYVDFHGDVAGRRRVQVTGEIVEQAAEAHGGRIIKSLGDGWMLLFLSPQDAIQAAVRIQRDLEETQRGVSDRVHLRIGIDCGRLLEETDDVYGDVVNVSSRLAGRCQSDGILLSQSTFEKVGPYFQNRCSPVADLTLRGKPGLATGYQLNWHPGQYAIRGVPQEKKIVIEVLWNGTESRMTLSEALDSDSTVQSYEAHTLQLNQIEETSTKISETIRMANLDGALRQASVDLENHGKLLFDLLFPDEMKRRIRQLTSEFLILKLDDACVHIPWELANDGHDFLCCRFSLGRMVRTSQSIRYERRPLPTETLSLLVLSDPSGNLPSAALEGKELYDLCRHDSRVDMVWLNGRILTEQVESRLAQYDMVHYCGHAEHNSQNPDESGWLLSDGHLSAGSFRGYAERGETFPLLVFNNACHSGDTAAWDQLTSGWSYGFANALLLAGCGHYVGAVCELLDAGSKEFSKVFYKSIISGHPVGRSLRQARVDFRACGTTHSLTWAQYVLYGDPEAGLFAELVPTAGVTSQPEIHPAEELRGSPSPCPETVSTNTEETVRSIPQSEPGRARSKFGPAITTLIIFALLLSVYWISSLWLNGTNHYLQLGDRYEREGNLPAAFQAYDKAASLSPEDAFIQQRRVDLQRKVAQQNRTENDALAEKQWEGVRNDLNELEGKIASSPLPTTPVDRWSSRPLSIALLLSSKLAEDTASSAGINPSSLAVQLQDRLTQSGWSVIDRSRIREALLELRLGASDAADPNNSARVGHLLAARIIASMQEVTHIGKPSLRISLTDTERGVLVSTIRPDSPQSSESLIDELTRGVTASLMEKYPLQGKVTQIDASGVVLNIGTVVGVKIGDVFGVYPQASDLKYEDILMPQEPLAKITVQEVEERVSRCAPPGGGFMPELGMRVRIEGR